MTTATRQGRAGKVTLGLHYYRNFVGGMRRQGWIVDGHESLSTALMIAAFAVPDDVAKAQLHDLYEDSGMGGKAEALDALIVEFRDKFSRWPGEGARATFYRHCRKHNVYRRRA